MNVLTPRLGTTLSLRDEAKLVHLNHMERGQSTLLWSRGWRFNGNPNLYIYLALSRSAPILLLHENVW